MKKKFILHIGPHKTGSTYIQKTLFDNKINLLEKDIEYSEIMKDGHIAHHDLAEKLYTKQYNSAYSLLEKIKSTDKNILLSSENFDRLDIEDIEFLAESIKGFQVEIIFFKRRLDDLLISNWQEAVKHGAVESWAKFSFGHLLQPFLSEILNNIKILDSYSYIFNKEKIKIIDYDNAKASGEDICNLFFEAMNLTELQGLSSGSIINKSMDYSTIEIIRVLNVLYIEKLGVSPHHFLRDHFLDMMRSDKDNELIKKIKETIEKNLEPLNLNNTFLFNFLNTNFDKKYRDIVINDKLEMNIQKGKRYELPNENWYLQSDILRNIELIYKQVENHIK